MSVDQDAALAAVEAQIVPLGDSRYPPLLRTIHDPPPALYVRGDPALLQRPHLALVGARRASAAGLQLAQSLSSALAAAGLGVCSGLALGIDAAAHRGALSGGGATVAVMATGIETVYPRRHLQLAGDILVSGCLISEFPPGTPPRRENFPRRNRIISGLSLGVLVVEAALHSGSLITARCALEQGREVFALPWSVAHGGGAGCLRLLRDGAKMVLDVDDILVEIESLCRLQGELLQRPESEPAAHEDCGAESAVLSLLGDEATTLDRLVACSGLPASRIMAELSLLEVAGSVTRCPGGYARTRRAGAV